VSGAEEKKKKKHWGTVDRYWQDNGEIGEVDTTHFWGESQNWLNTVVGRRA